MAFSVLIEEKDSVHIIKLRDEGNSTEAEIYSFGALLNGFTVTSKNKKSKNHFTATAIFESAVP